MKSLDDETRKAWALLFKQVNAQIRARDAYVDDSYSLRNCDFCCRFYRGPAVYCSMECAIADATKVVEMTVVQIASREKVIEEIIKAFTEARGTPVANAMQKWIEGEPVLRLDEFFFKFGKAYRSYRRDWNFDPSVENLSAIRNDRDIFVGRFGFAVPTAEALDRLVKLSPLLEVGAGSGAWGSTTHTIDLRYGSSVGAETIPKTDKGIM